VGIARGLFGSGLLVKLLYDRVRPIMRYQFVEYLIQVSMDGPGADPEQVRNLFVGMDFAEQGQNLMLPRRQLRQRIRTLAESQRRGRVLKVIADREADLVGPEPAFFAGVDNSLAD